MVVRKAKVLQKAKAGADLPSRAQHVTRKGHKVGTRPALGKYFFLYRFENKRSQLINCNNNDKMRKWKRGKRGE